MGLCSDVCPRTQHNKSMSSGIRSVQQRGSTARFEGENLHTARHRHIMRADRPRVILVLGLLSLLFWVGGAVYFEVFVNEALLSSIIIGGLLLLKYKSDRGAQPKAGPLRHNKPESEL